jgi:hypothetical protein
MNLLDLTEKKKDTQHVLCALRSGIPICCIKFWMSKKWKKVPTPEKIEYGKGFQYISCPDCKGLEYLVEIKICSVEDFKSCHIKLCYESQKVCIWVVV